MRKSNNAMFTSMMFVCVVSSVTVLLSVAMCIFLTALGINREMITMKAATYLGLVLQFICVYAGMYYVCRKSENRLAAAIYYILPILIMQLCLSYLMFDGIRTNYFVNLLSVIAAAFLGLYTKKDTNKRAKSRKRARSYR